MAKNNITLNKLKLKFFIGLLLIATLSFSQSNRNILVLGDSNGAMEHGWVNQLKKMLPNNSIFNTSISGNTIGFNNLDRNALNTLNNLDSYLQAAQDSLETIDYVLIMLGTNDAKNIFKERQQEVFENMELLISRINNYNFNQAAKPIIFVMSPPPYGSDKILSKKYVGGSKRVKHVARNFKKIAKINNCTFIDVYKELKPVFNQHSKDGIHLNEVGQKLIATLVVNQLNNEQLKLIEN